MKFPLSLPPMDVGRQIALLTAQPVPTSPAEVGALAKRHGLHSGLRLRSLDSLDGKAVASLPSQTFQVWKEDLGVIGRDDSSIVLDKSGLINQTAPMTLMSFSNLVVMTIHGFPIVLDLSGAVVHEVSARIWPILGMYDLDLPNVAFMASRRGSGFLAFGDEEVANYCHWVTDTVSRIALLWKLGLNDIPAILPPLNRQWQYPFIPALRNLGFGSVVSPALGAMKFDTIFFSSNYGDQLRHPAHHGSSFAVQFLNNLWGTNTPILNADRPPVRLFVSRADSAQRQLQEEEVLFQILANYGFSSIRLSEMSPSDQAHLFHSAEVVVGAHGAGLTNIVYCAPGTTVLEIAGDTYDGRSFEVLARGCHLRYGKYQGVTVGAPSAQSDIKVNPHDVAEALIRALET